MDLKQGVNVLSAVGNFSTKNRYRVYRVMASNDYSGKTFAEVTDDSTPRKRRWVMVDERWSTKECCEDRAMWEAKHRQAVANAVSVVVDGWRQNAGGPLWVPGLSVRADIPSIILSSLSYKRVFVLLHASVVADSRYDRHEHGK